MVKSETGETYTVHFSANTRIMKQVGGMGGGGRRGGGKVRGRARAKRWTKGGGQGQGGGQGYGERRQSSSTNQGHRRIKVGDAIAAMGRR